MPKETVGIVSCNFGVGTRHKFLTNGEMSAEKLYRMSHTLLQDYAARWQYPLWYSEELIMQKPVNAKRKGLLTKTALVLSAILDELRKGENERLDWL